MRASLELQQEGRYWNDNTSAWEAPEWEHGRPHRVCIRGMMLLPRPLYSTKCIGIGTRW